MDFEVGMQGQITTYDNKKGVGRVQGEDGHIYRFTRKELAQGEDSSNLVMEMQVSFTPSMDQNGYQQASEIVVLNRAEFAEDSLYMEPESFVVAKEDLVPGYDVLDRGLYALERGDRTEDKAKARLINECTAVGANGLVRYHCEVQLKNAFGYGFNVYRVSGVPVVLGRRVGTRAEAKEVDMGYQFRASELNHRLNQAQIKKAHNLIVNTKLGKLVLKAIGALLLFIFALGFILTGGI